MRAKLMTILLAAGLGLGADAAHASYTVKVKQRTLVMTGGAASESLVLRAGARNIAVDLRGDGRADLRVARARFTAIRVQAGAGNDTIRVSGRVPATLDGGRGNDRLIGGRGRDLLLGGKGRDTADGNGGSDRVRLGAGADRFLWQAGDGRDAVDGAAGVDASAFTGSDAGEAIQLAPGRVTLGGIVTRVAGIERVRLAARGGADALTVDDQSATPVRAVTADLGGPDTASDRVVVNGSAGSDVIQAADDSVTGLAAAIGLTGRDAGDALAINALGGDDRVSAPGLTTAFTADGGDGADTLAGGRAADALLGGEGGDRFVSSSADGNDAVTGQGGQDVLAFTGADVDESFTATADGGRVRFTSTTGNVATTLDDVEQVDVAMLGGEDELTVRDLSGTDLTGLNATLGADARPDDVFVTGSDGDDVFTVRSGPSGAAIAAGGRTVALSAAEPARDRLVVNALGGNDVVSSSGLAADVVAFMADGGPGRDELVGGPARETFSGGDGPDDVRPGPGDDSARLGSDEDVYRWNSGDGSDSVDGEAGFDTLIARGTAADEDFTIRTDGPDAKLDVGTVFLGASLRNVEDIALEPLGGSNRILLEDVSATSVQGLQVSLRDGNEDTVTVQGSAAADTIAVVPVAIGGVGQARVLGLPGDPSVIVGGGQPADDVLEVEGLAGDDRVDATALPAGTFPLTLGGGSGNDLLLGGAGAERLTGGLGDDRLDGGAGPDRLFGGDGDDDLFGGPGDDILRGGDGNDNLIGGAGTDDLDGEAGNDTEIP